MPLTQGFTCHNDLQEIEWRNQGIMKKEMPSLLLDEKICFIGHYIFVKHWEKICSIFGRYLISCNSPCKRARDIMPTA
jgi:hypothetical protein